LKIGFDRLISASREFEQSYRREQEPKRDTKPPEYGSDQSREDVPPGLMPETPHTSESTAERHNHKAKHKGIRNGP